MVDDWTIATSLRLADGCIKDAFRLEGSRNNAYLAEQALEQVIRAIATSEKIYIPRADAHQLTKVVRTFPDEMPEKQIIARLAWIEEYATTFRYATPTGKMPSSPNQARLAAAITEIEALVARVSKHFQVDLEIGNSPAGRTAPIRHKP